jgi:hypothetical protein
VVDRRIVQPHSLNNGAQAAKEFGLAAKTKANCSAICT